MIPQTPQDLTIKNIGETYRHYSQAIETMIDRLWKQKEEEPIIGATPDETLVRAYRHAGYQDALHDVLEEFRRNA